MSSEFNKMLSLEDPRLHNVSELSSDEAVLSVSDFVRITSQSISRFGCATVSGEIQHVTSRGHIYFTLKDDFSTVDCIMWQSTARKLSFVPQAGLQVIVRGSPNLWEKNAQFRLICTFMQQSGRGLIMERLLKLKEQLQREGVFDRHKRPIPDFIDTVGIITSETGHVLHDMTVTMQRRNPGVNIVVYPARVQGEDAPASLISALDAANEENRCDVLIIGRGGGSFEDLLPFSDEALTRAVASSAIPVISAVGHEPDFSFSDYAADIRAATPTAAAELVTKITRDMLNDAVSDFIETMHNAIVDLHSFYANRLEILTRRIKGANPENYVASRKSELEIYSGRLSSAVFSCAVAREKQLAFLKQRLSYFEPQSLIERRKAVLGSLVSRLNDAVLRIEADAKERLHFDSRTAHFERIMDRTLKDRLERLNELVLRQCGCDIEKRLYEKAGSFYQTLQKLQSSDPMYILSKGYSITYDSSSAPADARQLEKGDRIRTLLKGGQVISVVEEVLRVKTV